MKVRRLSVLLPGFLAVFLAAGAPPAIAQAARLESHDSASVLLATALRYFAERARADSAIRTRCSAGDRDACTQLTRAGKWYPPSFGGALSARFAGMVGEDASAPRAGDELPPCPGTIGSMVEAGHLVSVSLRLATTDSVMVAVNRRCINPPGTARGTTEEEMMFFLARSDGSWIVRNVGTTSR